jgi:hypothetical protein
MEILLDCNEVSYNLSEMLQKQDACPTDDGFKSVSFNYKADPCLTKFFSIYELKSHF